MSKSDKCLSCQCKLSRVHSDRGTIFQLKHIACYQVFQSAVWLCSCFFMNSINKLLITALLGIPLFCFEFSCHFDACTCNWAELFMGCTSAKKFQCISHWVARQWNYQAMFLNLHMNTFMHSFYSLVQHNCSSRIMFTSFGLYNHQLMRSSFALFNLFRISSFWWWWRDIFWEWQEWWWVRSDHW